jgi:hypothetical protein
MLLRSELLLLALAGALLFLGGGVGCQPTLAGVTFRAANDGNDGSPDWWMAFTGKKAPGTGEAQLPFTLESPFRVAARMGVFDPDALAASVGAGGCIGLRDTESSDEHRLCVALGEPPDHVEVTFAGTSVFCPGVTRAWLDLAVDGATLVAKYRCGASGDYTTLDTAPSEWQEGERWNAFVSAVNLAKGAQLAFDELQLESKELLPGGDPRAIAYTAFEALVLGIEAVYEVEDNDPFGAADKATEASNKMRYCVENLSEQFAADSDADKLLAKAAGGHAKLTAGTVAKYVKGFAKTAAADANALEALEAGF